MKFTMNTVKLQDMVAKAMKGASNNKLIPLTNLMAIQLKDHKLTLITTDATNFLYIMEDKVAGDDFYVVVQTDIFSKLIARLTCENVTMELVDEKLTITGNGEYSLELPLDEEGKLIHFPDPINNVTIDVKPITVNLSTVKLILTTAKAALATAMDVPCYTGYYVGDKVVSTDTYKICGISIELFPTPRLISPELMNLLDVMTAEKIDTYLLDDDVIVFRTDNCAIFGKAMEGLEDYQIDAISGLLDQEFESSCKIPRDALLQLLDRLSLFVDVYDKNGIYLTFTKEGLVINSKQSSGSELIKYADSKNFHDFIGFIDIEMLYSQVKANSADIIEIQYGEDNAIKMIDGNVTQIVALLDEDSMN